MDCDAFLSMLDNYDDLTDAQKQQMRSHAQECESCKRELLFLESVINTTKTLPKIEVGSDFLENLNMRIDSEEAETANRFSHLKKNWHRYSAIAACVLLVAVVGANSDRLIDKMGNDASGVIRETAATPLPKNEVSATPAAAVQKPDDKATPAPGVKEENTKVKTTPQKEAPQKEAPKKEDTAPAVSQNTVRNTAKATAVPKVTAEPPVQAPAEAPAVTEAPAQTSEPAATEAPPGDDDGYSLNTDAPENIYAIGDGYSISTGGSISYEIGVITINSKQYDRAMGILIECINGSVGDCFNINASDLGTLEARLTNAGVEFDAYMPEHDGIITFKIAKY